MKRSVVSTVFATVLAFAALSTLSGASAASAAIEDAKSRCIVGEQADGYLGVVKAEEADDALRREVRDVNQQRKAYYAEIATRNGVTIEVTAALTAEKLINQAPSGQCVRNQQGVWLKKP
ncbi:MAG: YdbL family protein [Parvularculaceae bacterium]